VEKDIKEFGITNWREKATDSKIETNIICSNEP
jgi:hypothetical protein